MKKTYIKPSMEEITIKGMTLLAGSDPLYGGGGGSTDIPEAPEISADDLMDISTVGL